MLKPQIIRFRAQVAALSAGLLFAGCFSASQPHDLTQRINEANAVCGDQKNFKSYPLSDQCVALFGKYAPLMRRKSDLVVAEEKACTPTDSQFHLCETTMDGQPSCVALKKPESGGKGEKRGDPNFDTDAKQCVAATINECGFVFAAGTEGGRPEDYDPGCKEAKDDLKNFDTDLQRAEMQQAFAPQLPTATRPVIIQQAPAPNYLAPLWVPSPPAFTQCTNFGPTTNCITH